MSKAWNPWERHGRRGSFGRGRHPLRVANVIEEGRYGGPQGRIASVAAGLRDLGIITTVIHPKKFSGIFEERLEAKAVEHRGVPLHRVTRQPRLLAEYVATFLPELYGLVRELRAGDFDVVHCNGAWQVKGIIAARLAGLPVVWHLNDTQAPALVRFAFEVIAAVGVDAFVIAGKRVGEYYLRRPPLNRAPRFEIPAPVDTSRFDPERVDPDPVVSGLPGLKVITVANLNPLKGLEMFIDVCERVSHHDGTVASFVIAGATYETQRVYARGLQEEVRKRGLRNLHFLGHVQDIASVLKAADVYVCTSRFEASPVSVWEAMSMSLPVVSTDVGDVAGVLGRQSCGYVVDPDDVGAMAKHLQEFLRDPALRNAHGAMARQTAREYLDIARCVALHAQCYGEVVGASDYSSFAAGAGY